MPVRKLTKEEARAIFGGGLVLFGPRRQQPSPLSSEARADPMQPVIDAIEQWLSRPLESAPAPASEAPEIVAAEPQDTRLETPNTSE